MEKAEKQSCNGNMNITEKSANDTKIPMSKYENNKKDKEELPIFGFSYLNPMWKEEKICNVEKTIPNGMEPEITPLDITLDKMRDEMRDDVKFLAPCLIHKKQLEKQMVKKLEKQLKKKWDKKLEKQLKKQLDEAAETNIIKELLKRKFDLKEVAHHEFINLLSNEIAVDEDEIKMYTDKYPDIPTLYIHPFENNTIEGFPLYFIAQKFKENEDVCIQRMELILKLDSDINAKHRNEPTALHYAVEQGMWQVVQFLIDKGACDVDGGRTKDLIAEVKPELAQTLDIMTPKPQFDPIFEALYDNDEAKFKELLQEKPPVNIDNGKETLLQLAVSQKRENLVAKLIKKRVDVNAVSACYTEPILLALRNENLECLEKLLDQPEINLRVAHSTETIFHEIARISNTKSIDKVLIKKLIHKALSQGVSLHAVNSKSQTAFDIMVKERDTDDCSQLLSCFFPFLDIHILDTIPPSKFDDMFDRHITYEENSREKKVTLKYDFLKCDNEEFDEPEMPIFYQMSQIKKMKATLAHPLIKLFLIYKFRKVVFVSILRLILYLLFAFSLSVHVYNLIERREDQNEKNATHFQTKDSSTSIHLNNVNNSTIIIYNNATNSATNSSNSTTVDDDSTHTTTYIVGGIFWVIIFLREIVKLVFFEKLDYFRNWENALYIALLIFSLLSYIPVVNKITLLPGSAIVIAYMILTILIGKFFNTSSIGMYIEMFKRVTIQTFKVLTTFVAVIISFAFGFFVIFHDSSEYNVENFNSMWDSILRTSGMAIGELNLDQIETLHDKGKEILLLIFIIFIPIILLNVLNALAISDTKNIIDKSGTTCYIKNISYYAKIEAFFMFYDLRTYKHGVTAKPTLLTIANCLFRSNHNDSQKTVNSPGQNVWMSRLALVFPRNNSGSKGNESSSSTELKFEKKRGHNNIYKLVECNKNKEEKSRIRLCMSAIYYFVCRLLIRSLRPNTICLEIEESKCNDGLEIAYVAKEKVMMKRGNVKKLIEKFKTTKLAEIENLTKLLDVLKDEILNTNDEL